MGPFVTRLAFFYFREIWDGKYWHFHLQIGRKRSIMCNVVLFLLGSALQTGATAQSEHHSSQSLHHHWCDLLDFPSRLPLWRPCSRRSGSGCPDPCCPHVLGRDFQCKCSRIVGCPATTLHYDRCDSDHHSSYVCMKTEVFLPRYSLAVSL